MISDYIDFDGLKEKFPNLNYDAESNTLAGNVSFSKMVNDEVISGCYDLLIDFNKSSIPFVYDKSKKVKRNYEHRYDDGHLCLAPDLQQILFLEENKKISLWLDIFVVSYFISYEYYIRYGEYPFGTYSHGLKGIMEFYEDYFQLAGEQNSFLIIEYIMNKKYRGHDYCPCGSMKRLRDCHGKKIVECKNSRYFHILLKEYRSVFNEKR